METNKEKTMNYNCPIALYEIECECSCSHCSNGGWIDDCICENLIKEKKWNKTQEK